MEGHPIPQNVTSFQFRLIGDMTLKQFAYLAIGVAIGWFFFSLSAPAFLKLPPALLFGILGFAFAFVPFEGRPLDIMLTHFAKSLFIPNIFVFQKVGGELVPPLPKTSVVSPKTQNQAASFSRTKLDELLNAQKKQTVSPVKRQTKTLDEKELAFLDSLSPHFVSDEEEKPREKVVEVVHKEIPDTQQVQKQAEQKEQQLNQTVSDLQKKLLQTQQAQPSPDVSKEAQGLEKLLKDTQFQKEELERQLNTLKNQLSKAQQKTFTAGVAQPPEQTQLVRRIPKGMTKSVGVPLTPDVPNVITGIIKDARGAILPNILVEVKDKSGNPVRAFKTNGLGQFASATPLQNGTFTIVFEDPSGEHLFDAIELPVSGVIIEPLEIIAKDPRDDLRKALFSPISSTPNTAPQGQG